MKSIVEALTVVFAALALSLLAGSCSSGGDYCQLSGYAQGGTYSIKVSIGQFYGIEIIKPFECR